MKEISLKLCVLLLALFSVLGCAKDEETFTGNIVGKITDDDGEVLPSVTVTISPSGLSKTTGSDGSFEFVDLEPMQYSLLAKKDGYKSNYKTVNVVIGRTAVGDMVLTKEVNTASVSIDPSTLNFGTTQKQLAVTISNNGNASASWSLNLGENSWLSASPTSGIINVNKTQSVVFAVDRDKVAEEKSVIVTISADGNSLPITVTCSPKNNKKAEMVVEPTTLDFGESLSQKELNIKNVGEADLNWRIKGISGDILTVSESSGTIVPGGSKIVKVNLDRENITTSISTSFIITDGEKEKSISVSAVYKPKRAEMTVEPTSIDFGEELVQQNLYIKNTGNADLNWQVYGIKVEAISVSEDNGTIVAGGMKTVKVNLDRNKMDANINTSFVVTDGERKQTVTVRATKTEALEDELVASQGLYVYYKFDGDFNDATENGVNGFGSNGPTFVPGVTSESKAVKLSLSKKSSFVVPQSITDFRTMTICFWGKNFTEGSVFHTVTSVNNSKAFSLSVDQGALKFICTRYNCNYQYANKGKFTHPTIDDGQWHHIAIVSDFNQTTYATITSTLYVDGVAVDVITEDANPYTEAEDGKKSYGSGIKFVLGGETAFYSKTLGATNLAIDNFRVYNSRKLSADDIKAIYKARQ